MDAGGADGEPTIASLGVGYFAQTFNGFVQAIDGRGLLDRRRTQIAD